MQKKNLPHFLISLKKGIMILLDIVCSPKHEVFMLGTTKASRDSKGFDLFITTAPIPDLNDKVIVFGRVIKGEDIVQVICCNIHCIICFYLLLFIKAMLANVRKYLLIIRCVGKYSRHLSRCRKLV